MGLYTASHSNPQGAGDSRPTALQIVKDEGLEGKLHGKVIVLTGATSGIGLETARALSATGATIYLTARDLEKGEQALKGILEPPRVSLVKMDNNSNASIKAAATEILKKSGNRVNILINNAGVMGLPERTLSADGVEVHFATNYLSEFLLFQLLKPAMLAAASPAFHSRLVNVSSSAMRAGHLPESGNYSFEKGGYDYQAAYNNSKIASVYMANQVDRLYGSKGLHATSVHPGGINTNIARHLGPGFVEMIMQNEFIAKVVKSLEQGAATTVLAAVGKEWENKGGKYLEDCEEAKRGKDDNDALGAGYVSQTYDPKEEERLWKDSFKMVGMTEAY